jgi:hypothetical protein
VFGQISEGRKIVESIGDDKVPDVCRSTTFLLILLWHGFSSPCRAASLTLRCDIFPICCSHNMLPQSVGSLFQLGIHPHKSRKVLHCVAFCCIRCNRRYSDVKEPSRPLAQTGRDDVRLYESSARCAGRSPKAQLFAPCPALVLNSRSKRFFHEAVFDSGGAAPDGVALRSAASSPAV